MDHWKKAGETGGILEKFKTLDYRIAFQCAPDGRVPREHFDYHIHKYWELKFTLSPAVFCIHPPLKVHCATMPDAVLTVSHSHLRVCDCTMEFSGEECRANMLPGVLNLLAEMPEGEKFDGMRHKIADAAIENLLLLLKSLPTVAARHQRRDPADIALEYMDNHYFHSDLSVNDIAHFIGISPQHLNLAMRRKTGQSIIKNLVRIRLEHAAELLADPNYMVKDVAAMTGWHSAFYFSNTFRHEFGYPPGEHRTKSSADAVSGQ